MSKTERRKGQAFEREVAAAFVAEGYSVRNLEGLGDALAIGSNGRLMHVEAKRQERLQLWEWIKQAEQEAPPNVPPVVVFRRSNDVRRVCLTLDDLFGLLRG